MSKVRAVISIRQLFLAVIVAIAVGDLSIASHAVELVSESEMSLVQDRAEIDSLVRQIHRDINQYRAKQNLPPLTLNTQISKQAEIHSQNMAQQVVQFSHQGFETSVDALKGQIVYRRAAENVAYNQGYKDPAKRAVEGWLKSEGHHQNTIGDFNLTGIGVAKNKQGEYYFTQIFIKEN